MKQQITKLKKLYRRVALRAINSSITREFLQTLSEVIEELERLEGDKEH